MMNFHGKTEKEEFSDAKSIKYRISALRSDRYALVDQLKKLGSQMAKTKDEAKRRELTIQQMKIKMKINKIDKNVIELDALLKAKYSSQVEVEEIKLDQKEDISTLEHEKESLEIQLNNINFDLLRYFNGKKKDMRFDELTAEKNRIETRLKAVSELIQKNSDDKNPITRKHE